MSETRGDRLARWARDLHRLRVEMEAETGDRSPDVYPNDLEILVLIAWKEAGRQLDAARKAERDAVV